MKRQISKYSIVTVFLFSLLNIKVQAQEKTNPKNQDEELGTVSWYRNYNEAIQASKKTNKPVLILFQEIPGCATCRNYGHNVLSNPLLVDAIENEFIPLAIHNNKGGKDKLILQKFNEPSWNNPVVRIVNAQGKDIAKRVGGNYSAKGLYQAMVAALKAQKKPIPEYMNLLGAELSGNINTIEEKCFSMYCFWTGQKQLGAIDGVVSAEPGFIDGYEVVKVLYNKNKVSEGELTTYAKKDNFRPINNNSSYRTATNDEQFYLKQTIYKHLPLSELQKTKINSALGKRQSPIAYLSPKQLDWLNEIKKSTTKQKVLYNQDFSKAWNLMALGK